MYKSQHSEKPIFRSHLTSFHKLSTISLLRYGEASAYGVVTKVASVRNGINNFLAGYIPAENMRFRAETLTFSVSGADGASPREAAVVSKRLSRKISKSDFSLRSVSVATERTEARCR